MKKVGKVGTSLLVLCLNEKIGKKLANSLADVLGLHFASGREIVAYELFDENDIIQKCGIAYFKKREKSALKGLALYEDSVIFLTYDLFVNNKSIFKKIYPKIYLKLSKEKLEKQKDTINVLAFEERDKLLLENSDLSISVSGDNKNSLTKILKELNNL